MAEMWLPQGKEAPVWTSLGTTDLSEEKAQKTNKTENMFWGSGDKHLENNTRKEIGENCVINIEIQEHNGINEINLEMKQRDEGMLVMCWKITDE